MNTPKAKSVSLKNVNRPMGKYNFDEIVNRRGTNCVKWDEEKEDGIIPLWVADMDFPAAPAIRQAVEKRVQHGISAMQWWGKAIMTLSSIGFNAAIIGLFSAIPLSIPQE